MKGHRGIFMGKKNFHALITVICLLGVHAVFSNPCSAASYLKISGWHLPWPEDSPSPPDWLGQDPIIGRLTCPPLSYVNLSEARSIPLLLKKVTEKPNLVMGSIRSSWSYELRSGLYFWDGTPVTAVELKDFLVQNLAPWIARQTGGSVGGVPEFTAEITGTSTVTVKWREEPAFGPYVMNNAPFYNAASSEGKGEGRYQCAGLYQPRKDPEALVLAPVRAYGSNAPSLVFTDSGGEEPAFNLQLRIDAGPPDPTDALGGKQADGDSCRIKAEAPIATILFWNPQGPNASRIELRSVYDAILEAALRPLNTSNAYNGLLPAILRAEQDQTRGGSALGRSPAQRLLALGYARPSTADKLKGQDGKSPGFVIKLGVTLDADVQSTLKQAFLKEGIELQFSGRDAADAPDAYLSTVVLPQGNQNYLPLFHSTARSGEALSWRQADKGIDRLLEAHLAETSGESMSFASLRDFEKMARSNLAYSVLFRYRLCIDTRRQVTPAGDRAAAHLDFNWFKEMLL